MSLRRVVLPSVVAGGLSLFGLGVGGLHAVDGRLEAASRPSGGDALIRQAIEATPVRDDCPSEHRRDRRL